MEARLHERPLVDNPTKKAPWVYAGPGLIWNPGKGHAKVAYFLEFPFGFIALLPPKASLAALYSCHARPEKWFMNRSGPEEAEDGGVDRRSPVSPNPPLEAQSASKATA